MIRSLFLLAAVALSLVNGHAVLVTPAPWNVNPSKTSPCGGGALTATSAANWQIGSTQTLRWRVVAADGAGTVTMKFSSFANMTFAATNVITLGAPTAVGNYDFTFQVPNIPCNGPNGVCSVQLASSSNWFSCATVTIAAVLPPPVPVAPTCAKPTTLTFCSIRNGVNVTVQAGQTLATIDQGASSVYSANLANPNVFANGNNTQCAALYKEFLCKNSLPDCGQTNACKQLCQQTLTVCGIQASHAGLYDCNVGPTCTLPTSAGVATSNYPTYTYPGIPTYAGVDTSAPTAQNNSTAIDVGNNASALTFGAALILAIVSLF